MSAVIFDLDGTLVDSRRVMDAAFRAAYLQEVGDGEPPVAEFFGLSGESFPRILEMLDLPASMYEPFRTQSRARRSEIILCEQAAEMCDWLLAEGVRLAVLTGKDRERTLEILDGFALLDKFAAIATGSDGFSPKPAPDGVMLLCRQLDTHPAMTAVAGDAAFDVLAGKRAGAWTIGCTWGVASARALAAAGADAVVHTSSELLETLEQWLDDLRHHCRQTGELRASARLTRK